MKASYRQLQELTGVDPSNWANWFTGKTSPTLKTLQSLAEKLEIPWLDFVVAFEERKRRNLEKPGGR